MAAAAAINSARKKRRHHLFETNPAVRKRQQTRLMRYKLCLSLTNIGFVLCIGYWYFIYSLFQSFGRASVKRTYAIY